jgi:NAD(P)H dehydrogenase (quinone)
MTAGRALVVLAHPRPGSLNHAVADRAARALREAGMHVDLHDLQAEGFDPVLRPEEAWTAGASAADLLDRTADPLVRRHRELVARADVLVAVHPNWWGKPPAVMAGWLDRVLVPGVAYALDDPGGLPRPLLALRGLLVVNTSDTPADRETEQYGDPLDAIWRRCLAPYLGGPVVERLVLRVVADADADQRAAWLAEVAAAAGRLARPRDAP